MEQIEGQVLKNREERKKKGKRGGVDGKGVDRGKCIEEQRGKVEEMIVGGGQPSTQSFNAVCLIMLC